VKLPVDPSIKYTDNLFAESTCYLITESTCYLIVSASHGTVAVVITFLLIAEIAISSLNVICSASYYVLNLC
jgi:hypothetical protein